MSEVIENYIRRHPQLGQQETFERFVAEPRIIEWMRGDPQRRERLQREFARVWQAIHSSPQLQEPPRPAPPQRPQPARPAAKPEPPKAPPPPPPPQPPAPRPAAPATANVRRPDRRPSVEGVRLQLLCAACGRFAIFSRGNTVQCARCGRAYENMLDLVPVAPVGPFAFIFGDGWKGAATAVGLLALLVGIYGVLRWV